ncbi:DNA-binding transcriptional LysR family regulator [Pseudomonas protegens]|jgi:DNA-binding transcriptional LysR family regulator|uniref:LysR family transcriptional regulator n=1 Tax=Pseudomonas protegens TaxID=380021 RepID=UPI000F46D003|nr:LysR family transcriptional regulator [Pseudomonas protegens]MDT3420143.1 DNA-binding transcriptional LysR family regulator [Pseudomonas protegens]ROM30798.1 LysR family transcriptional regulator [Pseudomonas protegens]
MHSPTDTPPHWDWYRTFLAVLDSGSLSAAGRAMGLTQPTVGRHIDQLEAALGLKLFTRSFDGFTATEAALELKPYLLQLAAGEAALRRVASSHGAGVQGSVRISASEIIGVEVLPPILATLRQQHPQLVVELVLSNRADDLLQRQADIAVRMFRPTQEALLVRRVADIELGLHAHRDYLQQQGTPLSLEQLAGHALIGFDRETAFIRRLQQQYPMLARGAFAWRSDSDLAQLAALRAGFGIGACQVRLAEADPRLVRVLAEQFAPNLEAWVAMHEDLRNSPRCAVTFAALVQGLAAYAGGD